MTYPIPVGPSLRLGNPRWSGPQSVLPSTSRSSCLRGGTRLIDHWQLPREERPCKQYAHPGQTLEDS